MKQLTFKEMSALKKQIHRGIRIDIGESIEKNIKETNANFETVLKYTSGCSTKMKLISLD